VPLPCEAGGALSPAKPPGRRSVTAGASSLLLHVKGLLRYPGMERRPRRQYPSKLVAVFADQDRGNFIHAWAGSVFAVLARYPLRPAQLVTVIPYQKFGNFSGAWPVSSIFPCRAGRPDRSMKLAPVMLEEYFGQFISKDRIVERLGD
jgi:hypothetical protein